MAGGRRACGRLGVRIRNGCGSGLHQSLRTHACCRLGSPSGSPPHSTRGPVVVRAHSSNQRLTPPRGRADVPPPSVRGKPACGCTRTGGSNQPRALPCQRGGHSCASPTSLIRVPLLHSWRRTRGVHEGAGRGFALTQHAHIVIIAVLYTRTTVALAPPQAPSHTKRSSPFQGPTAACACPMSPPQGCPIPILGRSVITYFRYADTYAGRPRLSSLVSRRVRMPTALSAPVSNVPHNPPNHTISNPTPDSRSRITSSGPA